jgi:trk system potassium uptake protein
VVEVEVGQENEGLAVRGLRNPGTGRLMALMRGERPVYFSRDTRLARGDRLVMAVDMSKRSYVEKIVPPGIRRSSSQEGAGGGAAVRTSGGRRGLRVIVAGCGRVGAQLSDMLSLDGSRVTVIDRDNAAFRRLSKTFQGEALTGEAHDLDTLEEAGIQGADVFAAITNYDNTNLMAAEVARSIYDVGKVVSRLYNPDKEQTFQALDIDYVCGTTVLAERFMRRLVRDRLNVLAWTANNRVLLVEFACPPRFSGKAVSRLEREEMLRVGLVSGSDGIEVATRDTVMRRGDKVIAAVLAGRLQKVRKLIEPGWTLSGKGKHGEEQGRLGFGSLLSKPEGG